MKRIFLTSGLVLCMACPAFADLTAPIENHENGIVAGTQANPVDPSCRVETLEGFSGTSTFTAQWAKNYYVITLNSNLGNATATGGSTAAAPTPLFTMKGEKGVYQTRTGDSEANYAFSDWVAVDQTPVDVLTTDPTGIYVNYTLDENLPAGRSATDTFATSTQAQRQFLGFFDSITGTNQYIDNTGALTVLGATTASNYSADANWYAQWSTVHPTVTGTPTIAGYTFQGWSETANGSVISDFANHKIGENTTLFAIWQANNINITFNCAKPVAGATIPGTANTYAVSATETVSANPANHAIAMDGHDELTETCSLNGWTFVGWHCASGLTTDSAATNPVGNITAEQLAATNNNVTGYTVYMKSSTDVECKAVWQQNNIGLTWKDGTTASGGNTMSVGLTSQSCDYDGGITLPTAPNRPGYTFNGWAVDSSNPAPTTPSTGD